MTLPYERTRAVLNTQEFLYSLLDPKDTPKVPKDVRQWARRCLKHYPNVSDMVRSAEQLPFVWGPVDAHKLNKEI